MLQTYRLNINNIIITNHSLNRFEHLSVFRVMMCCLFSFSSHNKTRMIQIYRTYLHRNQLISFTDFKIHIIVVSRLLDQTNISDEQNVHKTNNIKGFIVLFDATLNISNIISTKLKRLNGKSYLVSKTSELFITSPCSTFNSLID